MRAGRSFHRFPITVEREPRLAIVEHAEDIPGRRVEGSTGGNFLVRVQGGMEVGMEDPCGSPVPTGFRLTSAVYEIAVSKAHQLTCPRCGTVAQYSKAEFYI